MSKDPTTSTPEMVAATTPTAPPPIEKETIINTDSNNANELTPPSQQNEENNISLSSSKDDSCCSSTAEMEDLLDVEFPQYVAVDDDDDDNNNVFIGDHHPNEENLRNAAAKNIPINKPVVRLDDMAILKSFHVALSSFYNSSSSSDHPARKEMSFPLIVPGVSELVLPEEEEGKENMSSESMVEEEHGGETTGASSSSSIPETKQQRWKPRDLPLPSWAVDKWYAANTHYQSSDCFGSSSNNAENKTCVDHESPTLGVVGMENGEMLECGEDENRPKKKRSVTDTLHDDGLG